MLSSTPLYTSLTTSSPSSPSSPSCLLILELLPLLKAPGSRRPNHNLRHLFALIMSALRRLRELVIRCFAELNTRSHLALINGIANILRANLARSSYKR